MMLVGDSVGDARNQEAGRVRACVSSVCRVKNFFGVKQQRGRGLNNQHLTRTEEPTHLHRAISAVVRRGVVLTCHRILRHFRPKIFRKNKSTPRRSTRPRSCSRAGMASARRDASGRPIWHGLAAGSVAGASGVLIGHSFDTLKVQAQVGRVHSTANTLSLSGIAKLYRGIGPPLLTTGAMRSFYFGTYETVRPQVSRALRTRDDELRCVFVSGCATGSITAPATAPMQRLKLVQQMRTASESALSTVDAARSVLRVQGFRGLFRGLGVHFLLETLGSGFYLVSYSAAKSFLRRSGALKSNTVPGEPEPLAFRVVCGMFAGCCGWMSIYPLDVLRSRIMGAVASPPSGAASMVAPRAATSSSMSAAPHGIIDMVVAATRETYANGGIRGFYRGIGFTLLRAAPVAGVVLPVYDAGLAWLARSNRDE